MKTILMVLIFSFSVAAQSAIKAECTSGTNKFLIQANTSSDIKVSFQGETVRADGYIDNLEVDLVARFNSIGEMTLFAKRGKSGPESYVFLQGRRNPVYCN